MAEVASAGTAEILTTPGPKAKRDLMDRSTPPKLQPVPKHPFAGRTLAIVNDLSVKEQWYLYSKTRELKEAVRNGKDLTPFRLRDREVGVYTIFMEDSTRTKESFRNAAEFHGTKVNVFDAKTSSFTKNETITDTIKMLCGYSVGQSIFVIRSKLEGVCGWLSEAITEFAQKRGFPQPSFINAGDGKHEHPSQEMLDEFSFLEQQQWDTSYIHLALLGDLFHGRTVHSKVDGLRLYGKVDVDLIAPTELALPKMYEDRMRAAGYNVRKFASIDEYLRQEKVSKIWYFTRLQLERMGDKVLQRASDLRQAVTMRREFVSQLPPGTKFFHPLPRDSRAPTLPFWLDNTELNGWDQQSQNGYFTRIVLLGMLGGHFGSDFEPGPPQLCRATSAELLPGTPSLVSPRALSKSQSPGSAWDTTLSIAADFITEVPVSEDPQDEAVGLAPIKNGIIIRDLALGKDVETIWRLMYMVRSVLGLNSVGGQGVNRSSGGAGPASGFISVPDFEIDKWDRQPLKKLAAMAPGSSLSMVREGKAHKEFRLQVPPRIYGFQEISCKNPACVSHPANMQHEVPPYFLRASAAGMSERGAGSTEAGPSPGKFICKYCEHLHDFWQVWDYKDREGPIEYTLINQY
jgi:aspartate carbamoyltransferase